MIYFVLDFGNIFDNLSADHTIDCGLTVPIRCDMMPLMMNGTIDALMHCKELQDKHFKMRRLTNF